MTELIDNFIKNIMICDSIAQKIFNDYIANKTLLNTMSGRPNMYYLIGSNIIIATMLEKKNIFEYKGGQTIVFSAVNQIHWRPKRKFKEGEFCEIISMDYCRPDTYRFTGKDNPIDPEKFPERRQKYLDELQSRPDMRAAFDLWNSDGIADGIDLRSMG